MPDEPKTVCKERVEARMQVAKPIFFMGYKDSDFYGTPSERMRRDAAVTLLNEILFSRSGDFYNELFEKGILAPSFTCGYSICETLAFNCLSGETDTPDEVIARVQAYLDLVKREGIREEDIERCRRVLYADEVRSYDSTEEIANRLLSFAIDGGEMLAYPEMIAQITKEELVSLAETLFDRANLSVSVIYPLEQR
jgi:predicted Zn-dependent peptidase